MQSSSFLQAMGIRGLIGGGVGRGGRGSGLSVVTISAIGGGSGRLSSCSGIISSSSGRSGFSANGRRVVGVSILMAMHLTVGFPVVPGGHVHVGL